MLNQLFHKRKNDSQRVSRSVIHTRVSVTSIAYEYAKLELHLERFKFSVNSVSGKK